MVEVLSGELGFKEIYKLTPFLCNNASLKWENCVRHGESSAKRYYLASRSRGLYHANRPISATSSRLKGNAILQLCGRYANLCALCL